MDLTVINCDDCGKCCKHIGFPPFIYHEILNLPTDLQSQIMPLYHNRQELEISKQRCIWLDANNRCSNYDHRPKVCRDFEVGEEACLQLRKQIC
jgi:Fe-S-cluster containining protein